MTEALSSLPPRMEMWTGCYIPVVHLHHPWLLGPLGSELEQWMDFFLSVSLLFSIKDLKRFILIEKQSAR